MPVSLCGEPFTPFPSRVAPPRPFVDLSYVPCAGQRYCAGPLAVRLDSAPTYTACRWPEFKEVTTTIALPPCGLINVHERTPRSWRGASATVANVGGRCHSERRWTAGFPRAAFAHTCAVQGAVDRVLPRVSAGLAWTERGIRGKGV